VCVASSHHAAVNHSPERRVLPHGGANREPREGSSRRRGAAVTDETSVRAAAVDAGPASDGTDSAPVETDVAPVVTAVVPTYDENPTALPTVAAALDGLRTAWGRAEVVVVDDGSTDGTPAALRDRFADEDAVRVVVREDTPADLGQSVLDGVARARGDVVLVMDADGQHPPDRAGDVARPVVAGDADVAVGVRDRVAGDWPVHRQLISKGAETLVGLVAPSAIPTVSDPLSGYFAFDRALVADALAGVPDDPIGYKVLLEVLALVDDPRVTEVGYEFRERRGGESNLDAREYARFLGHLWSLGRRYR